jgi:hypothetical protein
MVAVSKELLGGATSWGVLLIRVTTKMKMVILISDFIFISLVRQVTRLALPKILAGFKPVSGLS